MRCTSEEWDEDWDEEEDEGESIRDGDEGEEEIVAPHLEIPYMDENMCVVSKPSGMLVHRSRESGDRIFMLQTLRNQIGRQVGRFRAT